MVQGPAKAMICGEKGEEGTGKAKGKMNSRVWGEHRAGAGSAETQQVD